MSTILPSLKKNRWLKYLEPVKKYAKMIISKQFWTKKRLYWAGAIVLVLAIGITLKMTAFKSEPKTLYQVAVVVRSQNNPDPIEDRRTSLKAGDIIVVQPETHSFSSTENISYLILKMSLTEDQKSKLTMPDERERSEDEMSEEEKQRIEEEKKRSKEAGREFRNEPRMVTEQTRAYYIDLKKLGFTDPNVLMNEGQPFLDKTFDWSVVEKKERIK